MNRRVWIIAAILLLAAVLPSADIFAGKSNKIRGWAWSENIGWVSMNCYNEEIANACLVDYGVDYDKNAQSLFGTAWSEYGGWLCFGVTCKDFGLNLTPEGLAPEARLLANGLISGWAAWPVLGADGWMKLLGKQSGNAFAKFYQCRNCNKTDKVCSFCFSDQQILGSRNFCTSCSNCDLVAGTCAACSTCYEYGMAVDFATNTLAGWAWNGDVAQKTGFGWFSFHPKFSSTEVHGPYVNVVGDVYSGGNIGSLYTPIAGTGKTNATFLLQSGGKIVHFDSACGDNCEQENVKLGFPKTETNYYADQLGFLDIKGLLAGQHGLREDIKMFGDIDNPLNGQVYYYDGDLYLNNDWIVNNGITGKVGNGTLVVRGNLYVNKNVGYQQAPVKNTKEIASLGVIVLKKNGQQGNIVIAKDVENLVGNFYAEGKISTGIGKKQLKVSGLMIAQAFAFQREFVDLQTKAPAEQIVYDGRVMVNTPPGFADVAKGMPEWVIE
ncbi:hypothetical protein HY932_01370 [Candidatus Falkowbacteria bacterium]|nr:hypothetical protein [Candidatus Falkowbacteria bacterium]